MVIQNVKTKRAAPRVRLIGEAHLEHGVDLEQKSVMAELVNVSIFGAGLKIGQELSTDMDYRIKISFYPIKEFEFNSQIIWKCNVGNSYFYGLRFKHVNLQNRLELHKLITENLKV
ncbi:MAG: PilZ domain-containing protein [bacterium]